MLVVHIGPRKTATTYLQQNLYRNRAELLARGWLYPVLAINAQNAHHEVVASLAQIKAGKGRLATSIRKAGKKASESGANILISSENFRKWKAADFRILGERFGQSEIRLAYTLRDPVDRMVSLWGEAVKNGKAPSLPAFVRKQLADPLKSASLNPLIELRPILAEPGLQLRVLDYEALKRSKTDIYQAFGLHILGLDDLVPAKLTRSNESFPAGVLDYLRLLARTMDFDPSTAERLFWRQFLQCHSPAEIEAIAAAVGRSGAGETVRISREHAWYTALEEEIRQTIGSMIVPALPDDGPIFSRGMLDVESFDLDALAKNPEIGNLLDQSVRRMRAVGLPFKRSRLARAWRYLKRLVSV